MNKSEWLRIFPARTSGVLCNDTNEHSTAEGLQAGLQFLAHRGTSDASEVERGTASFGFESK